MRFYSVRSGRPRPPGKAACFLTCSFTPLAGLSACDRRAYPVGWSFLMLRAFRAGLNREEPMTDSNDLAILIGAVAALIAALAQLIAALQPPP
jgi:hypothetical protein